MISPDSDHVVKLTLVPRPPWWWRHRLSPGIPGPASWWLESLRGDGSRVHCAAAGRQLSSQALNPALESRLAIFSWIKETITHKIIHGALVLKLELGFPTSNYDWLHNAISIIVRKFFIDKSGDKSACRSQNAKCHYIYVFHNHLRNSTLFLIV